jgi:hypothetical protein
MFRNNWRTLGFWRWWWHEQVPVDAKIVAAIALAVLLLVGGYFASGHLTGASAASDSSDSYVLQTTVTRVVTVKRNGKTIVKRVPVVIRRSIIHSKTSLATVFDTVTTPAGVRYVTRKVVRYVPVVRRRTIRVDGKTKTITETRLVPTVKTQTTVVTNERTVTNQDTVVVSRTNTLTLPVTTVETHTVTLPPETVTETKTETETVTETVTLPPETVTETVTTSLLP